MKNLTVSTIQLLNRKKAFTLAEVLITLGVIGVVAAITLPSFIVNYQTKVRNEQNRMVQYKLTQATDLMKSHGKIGNYATTKDFVNELKKYYKIAQICENDNLEQCWPTKVINTAGEELKVSDIKTGKGLNPTGWTKETIGIITADGTPMILTYKDDCPSLDQMKTYTWETEDNKPVKNATSSCIAAVYDLNGKSRPNKSGVDVRLFNAISIGDGVEANCKAGVCLMTTNISYSSLTKTECEEEAAKGYGITPCPEMYDNWAGAMKACHDAGARLPTMAELAQVGTYIYDKSVDNVYGDFYSTMNIEKNAGYNITEGYYFSNEGSSWDAWCRYFGSNYSSAMSYSTRGRHYNARCISN